MRLSRPIAAAAASALASFVVGIAHADPPAAKPAHDGVSARDVAAYTALGLGAAALVVGVAEMVHYSSLYQDADSVRTQVPLGDACANQVSDAAARLCQDSKDALTAWTVAWIGIGASAALATTGIVLLLTRSHDTTSNRGRLDVTPTASQRSAGLELRLSF